MPYTYSASSSNQYTAKKSVYVPTDKQLADVGLTNSVKRRLNFNLNRDAGRGGYKHNSAKYFDRYYSIYPEHELSSICQYVIFVRPDLNIINSEGNLIKTTSAIGPNSSPHIDQKFRYMRSKYPEILENLTSYNLVGSSAFMPILLTRTESMSLPDYTLKDYKMTQPFTDYNLPYASHALSSQTGGQFEVTFRDDDELRLHKLFATWVYYISGVTRNIFAPKSSYIRDNVMDYACSIYCITCKADATTILHWFKYTGCFPTSFPGSDMSFNLRGGANNKLSVNFDYFRASDPFDPLVLVDFNKNAGLTNGNKTSYMPIYNAETVKAIGMKNSNKLKGYAAKAPSVLGTGNGFCGAPFICKVGSGENAEYELRWRNIDIAPK